MSACNVCHCCARSYCKNLDFAEQQKATFTPGQYVNYDCVLPLGTILWILVAEVRIPDAISHDTMK